MDQRSGVGWFSGWIEIFDNLLVVFQCRILAEYQRSTFDSGPRWFSLTLLHERILRRIWWCNFPTLIHVVAEIPIVSSRALHVGLPLPTISKNSLHTLFCPWIFDHGVSSQNFHFWRQNSFFVNLARFNVCGFGFWGPNWLCQTTNLTQPCGSWTRVSSWDFCPSWLFWSPLQYPRNFSHKLHIEKNLRLWQRDPHLTLAQRLGHRFFSNFVLRFVLRTSFGRVFPVLDVCASKNEILLSPHPIDQEQGLRPFANSIQRKNLRFCGIVRHWRLPLAHPTHGNKCSTSRWYIGFTPMLSMSPTSLQQNPSLGKTPSTMLSGVSNMTILSAVTCVVNV